MSFTSTDLSPYSSHLIVQSPTPTADRDLDLMSLLLLIMEVVESTITLPRTVTRKAKEPGVLAASHLVDFWDTPGGARSVGCVYVEHRPVGWLPAAADKDQLHHLVIVTTNRDGLTLVTLTDAEHREAIIARFKSGYFTPWRPLPKELLIQAFVAARKMKTLWLSGAHRSTTVKPSAKIISGPDLRDAIDPMGDSTYLAGAVRSEAAGVSLGNSSAWIGPNGDRHALDARTDGVFQAIADAVKATPPQDMAVHAGLARRISDVSLATDCYHVEMASPETLSSGQGLASDLAARFSVELGKATVVKGKPTCAFTAEVTHLADGASAVTAIAPTVHDERVSFVIAQPPAEPFAAWTRAIEGNSSLLRVFYNSGHTISDGALAEARTQDRPFDAFEFADFSGYKVTQEKPPGTTLRLDRMMTVKDQSLFKWIFKEGLPRLKLGAPAPGRCWLFCDDGSSEVADFVHLDTRGPTKTLTLFHAKGANSAKASRCVAPGPYELVSAQATKNLRAFDAKDLLGRVQHRLEKKGKERVWDHPWAVNAPAIADAQPMIDALETLGMDFACRVVIVQPHVLKSKYIASDGTISGTVGARQLRALLSGVESLAKAVSAKLTVVTDQR
ncbi:hypothetical protein CDN99_05220 [Roseateles aquatilis]|uniref:Uncharacterized protein n=1 Tax=Roseateles aquatilis TaxID=431061 RepID=A0A246JMH9_9BURK|nr:hypothetical protein [Roseateles aquatilis]OWQ93836.1 hypothetical protein CDN99_05220 [Roseateles aquatilis]